MQVWRGIFYVLFMFYLLLIQKSYRKQANNYGGSAYLTGILELMFKSITDLVSSSLRRNSIQKGDATVSFDKIDGGLTENMRALRLVATMCDYLLSRGVAASDVVHIGLGITSTYCSQKVHIDISYTIISISQDRGLDREPLTMIRSITARGTDYRMVEALEELGRQIRSGLMPLDDAERHLDRIISTKRLYPRWVSHLSGGGIAAGVVMLYSADPLVWLVGFMMGSFISYVLYRLAKMGIPSFYSQALAGLIVTIVAVLVALMAAHDAIPLFDSVSPTIIIISGIVLLLAGMTIASALQDAIDEYYLTATARLLKVMMMTGGIVMGVTLGLYASARFGLALDSTPDRLTLSMINYQYLGAAILAAAFALGNQARFVGVIGAGAVGFLSLYVMLAATGLELGVIAATGLAAAFVGFSATVLQHFFRVPSLAIISAGIIPLVPGLTLYNGLMYVAQAAPNSSEFDTGVMYLTRAVLIAVAISAGVTLGNMIGRPSRRRLIYIQNRLPRRRLSAPWYLRRRAPEAKKSSES